MHIAGLAAQILYPILRCPGQWSNGQPTDASDYTRVSVTLVKPAVGSMPTMQSQTRKSAQRRRQLQLQPLTPEFSKLPTCRQQWPLLDCLQMHALYRQKHEPSAARGWRSVRAHTHNMYVYASVYTYTLYIYIYINVSVYIHGAYPCAAPPQRTLGNP